MTRPSPTRAPRGAGAIRIYNDLRRRIIDLELAPGADLDETALAAAFNISRTPLREALNRLASDQLVVISPNRGASVAPLTLTDLPTFIEALALAQSAVNAFAAMRRSDADLAAITAACDAFEAARLQNGLALTDANHAFHNAIAVAARNPHLATFYQRMLDQSARLARVSFSYEATGHQAHLDQVIAEHRAMVAAITAGDAATAESLGHDHAVLFQRRLMDWLSINDAATLNPTSERRT
ncbi:MAG TPA: GntR family transcriptional regulator [Thermohalobaculum sp.]|nr:GntR family transcriptional regulator [Thermohalobaculum sp.]